MTPKIADIRLVASHPEVYEPCDDSFALVDALLADRMNLLQLEPKMCLEIGCGSGYVITSLALILEQDTNSSVHCFATDINPDAVEVTSATLKAHGVHAEVMNMDIASALEDRLSGLVDVVVVNPPYVPTPEDEVGAGGIVAAWAGGEDGRSVIDRILPVADKLLSEKGWLYMLTLAANKPSELCGLMRKKGYASKIIVQRSTEEESLHVIKFWRDPDSEVQIKKTMANRGSPTSIFSRLSRLSFSGHGNANSK
uniref:Methyltransferase small domain-containing protein n=1 Tax=Chenopodium quinoa TaxID=63459 RepID=A0A803LM72_CHEQI